MALAGTGGATRPLSVAGGAAPTHGGGSSSRSSVLGGIMVSRMYVEEQE